MTSSVASLVHEARDHLTCALGHLHRVLPASSTIKRLQPTGDPGCQSCARAKDQRGRDYFSDTEKRESGSHRPLCIWCRRWFEGYRGEWIAEHPLQPIPQNPRRFWPPLCAVEWRRDNEGKNATPALWIEWRAAKRDEKKGRKKAS